MIEPTVRTTSIAYLHVVTEYSLAHQVVDLLRDKLHVLSAQVVDAKERIVELEMEKNGELERLRVFLTLSYGTTSRFHICRRWENGSDG